MNIAALTPAQTRHQQLVQLGILVATLGGVLSLIALYPGITGVEPKSGIGLLQILILIASMTLIVFGLWLFVKVTFYPNSLPNLAQRVAIRLSLTGLLFAAGLGMSDILGYGSNPPGENSFPILGLYQVLGMGLGFLTACLGVVIFWIAGPSQLTGEANEGSAPFDLKRTTLIANIIHPDVLERYHANVEIIRPIEVADAEKFLGLLRRLDGETTYMMLEPDERTTTPEEQTQRLTELMANENATIFVVEAYGQLVGFLEVEGGVYQRNRHTARIVVGILQQYTHQGIGKRLFGSLHDWAQGKSITRLELTVMSHNQVAIALYKKMGFLIEGVRRHALKVNGLYVDEFYMARLLDGLY